MSAGHEHYSDSEFDERPVDWSRIDAEAQACVAIKADIIRASLGDDEAERYIEAHRKEVA